VLAHELSYRTARAGAGVGRVRITGGAGSNLIEPTARSARHRDPRRMIENTVAAANQTGVRLVSLETYPIETGAVRVVAEVPVRALLADSEGRIALSFSTAADFAGFSIRLVAPNGVLIAENSRAGNTGSVAAPSFREVRSPALPPDIEGPTRLQVVFSGGAGVSDPQRAQEAVTLDCDAASTGVANPARACTGLRREWLRYLPPPEGNCIGELFGARGTTIAGVFEGVPLHRGSGGCSGIDAQLWAELLGVTP
jgi:hypothetical protein